MNRVHGVWAVGGEDIDGLAPTRAGAPSGTTSGALQGAEVVEAVLSWRDARGGNVLGVKEIAAGGVLTLGEQGDLMVPAEVLGHERFEIARFDGERALAGVPAGAKVKVDGWATEARGEIEVATGHVVEIQVGSFAVRLTRARAGTRIALSPLEGLRRGGAGVLLGSAIAHAAAFAIVAYVYPALGATEEESYDRDRVELMQKLLNASAQRELEAPPQDGASSSEGGQNTPSPSAAGAEGQAGKDTPKTDGRWAARGNARPEQVTLPRERELAAASTFGLIGLLSAAQGDPDAPTVSWGTTLNGADDVNRVGHLFGGTIDDAFGTGGWGLSGAGEGGGGQANVLGLGGGLGGLGTGTCSGPGPCSGIGHGTGKLPGHHESRFKGPRYGVPQSNGHLPAEVIQRIVRQNDGRYRLCYQEALRSNPNLQGRVTVKFLISRDGSVGFSSDGGSDIPDAGARSCVVRAFQNLSFPPPDSGVVTVFYPIVFNPE